MAEVLARKFIRLGDVDLEFFEGGKGQPLVYLHGGGGPVPDADFLESLADSFHLIAPSHPGFGRSNLPDWMDSIDDFAHIHIELINELELHDVILMGTSIGAWTAAEIATKRTTGLQKLILISPVGIKVGARDELDIPDIFAMPTERVNELLRFDPAPKIFDAAAMGDEELLELARNRETFALVTWEPYMHNPKLRHRLRGVTYPTLVLRGEADGLVSEEYASAYAALIPDAALETISEAGHSPQIENSRAFLNRVSEFVTRTESVKG